MPGTTSNLKAAVAFGVQAGMAPPAPPAQKKKKKMRVKKLAELPPAHKAVRDGDDAALAAALEVRLCAVTLACTLSVS